MLRTALIALVALAAAPAADAQEAGALLTIEISGLAPQGTVMLAVFDSQAGYDGNQSVAQRRADVSDDTLSVVIPGLAPGQYAFRMFHDVNSNGRMDTNPFGMPIEPFAFSNSAHGQFGPASWAEAVFTIDADGAVQRVSLGGH